MPQYVIQIQTQANEVGVGWLAKSFEVTPEYPIPGTVPANRTQVILTNTASFNAIAAVYAQYAYEVFFSYDEPGAKIDCSGAVTDSWPIN